MTVRKLILLAGLGLWIAGPVMAQDASNKAQNQKLADSIAEKIRTSGVIKKGDGTKVSIEARDGVVELSGTVASPEQHEQILCSVSKVSGIKRIESSMVGPLAPAMPVAERIPAPMAATSPPPHAVAGLAMAQDASNKAQNQKLADSIAEKIRTSGAIKKGDGTKVSIEVRDGVVELSGTVASPEQHEQILRSVSKVSGIKRIESSMVGPLAPAMPVAERIPAPMAVAVVPAMPVAERIPAPMAATSPPPYAPVTRTGGQGEGGPLNALPAPLGAAPSAATGEPVPLNGAPMMTALDPAGPRLPPYAWPTYAPYNNMSRVAYPQSYPYNAFPYIGPYYPFPKVPLGWRKVVLEWEDGHWYYGKLASPQDMWRVKFW